MKVTKLDESFCLEENLEEDLLAEGPIDWIKNKISKKPLDQRELDKKAKDRADKQIQKRRETKDAKFLAKDFGSQNLKSTFYIDYNYNKPMNQNQFRMWFEKEQQKIDSMTAGSTEQQAAQQKLDALRYNAIVVDDRGKYVRRGAEPLTASYVTFEPGKNDQVRNGYFIEPYKYKKTQSTNKKIGKSGVTLTKQDVSKFLSLCETTGMVIVDSKGKTLSLNDIKRIRLDTLNYYKVKLGNVRVPIPDWISKAKSKHLI